MHRLLWPTKETQSKLIICVAHFVEYALEYEFTWSASNLTPSTFVLSCDAWNVQFESICVKSVQYNVSGMQSFSSFMKADTSLTKLSGYFSTEPSIHGLSVRFAIVQPRSRRLMPYQIQSINRNIMLPSSRFIVSRLYSGIPTKKTTADTKYELKRLKQLSAETKTGNDHTYSMR